MAADRSAQWLLAEGADSAAMSRSVPMAKAMDDALLALYRNGERLRPENGYPLRLFLPGYEGNMSVKWLRRIKVTAGPTLTKDETSVGGDELHASPVAVVGEEQTQPCIVAEHGVEAAERGLLAGAVDEPGGVGLGAHWLPDGLLEVFRDRPPSDAPEHEPEHLGLDGRVSEAGFGRGDAIIEPDRGHDPPRRPALSAAWS